MNEDTFCGFSLREIRILGLRAELLEVAGTIRLLLVDEKGAKWEIRPITFREQGDERIPISLPLYHRGKQGPMHYQNRSAPAHTEGVRRLLQYVRRHEQYERTGVKGKIKRKR